MPLSMARTGEVLYIKKIGGQEATRRFLEGLGFVAGGMVTIVSTIGGNLIVNVKESRVAISSELANKIQV
jgi:ferrous iron transport protein A